jgi:hypothetical protein
VTTITDHDRLAAWDRVHGTVARLPGWRATPPQYHAEVRRWHATAYDGRQLGRGRPHEAIEATGDTEAAAVRALAELLEERASSIEEVAT